MEYFAVSLQEFFEHFIKLPDKDSLKHFRKNGT